MEEQCLICTTYTQNTELQIKIWTSLDIIEHAVLSLSLIDWFFFEIYNN